jgi:hypothetical protein
LKKIIHDFIGKETASFNYYFYLSCRFLLPSSRSGYIQYADLNANKNICNKHLESYKFSDRADVNQPIVSTVMSDTSNQPCAGGN